MGSGPLSGAPGGRSRLTAGADQLRRDGWEHHGCHESCSHIRDRMQRLMWVANSINPSSEGASSKETFHHWFNPLVRKRKLHTRQRSSRCFHGPWRRSWGQSRPTAHLPDTSTSVHEEYLGPTRTCKKTFLSPREKVLKEEQAGVCLSHSAFPHRRALPVRWFIAKATFADSVWNAWGFRGKKIRAQVIKKGRHDSESPAEHLGVPTWESTEPQDGDIERLDQRVSWVRGRLCQMHNRSSSAFNSSIAPEFVAWARWLAAAITAISIPCRCRFSFDLLKVILERVCWVRV